MHSIQQIVNITLIPFPTVNTKHCHSGTPKAYPESIFWIPAFAGMTKGVENNITNYKTKG